MSLGRVCVTVYGDSSRKRTIDNVSVDPAVMAQVAQKWRDGDSDGALEMLQHHIIERYDTSGTGVSSIMTIDDVPDPTTWA